MRRTFKLPPLVTPLDLLLIIGLGALILIGTISIARSPIEEKQLIERFGEEYRAYMRRTGRFFPRLIHRRAGSSGPEDLS